MEMTIESERFGTVEIDSDTVLEFPHGLIGLGGSRYALLSTDAESPFMWLQSLEDPSLALPVTDPNRFFEGFALEMSDDDAATIGIDATSDVQIYVTVRAAHELSDFTANLRAPIVVHEGRAHQVINQASGCELRAPLFQPA
jgi:flagellar assembly factor FliW